MGRNGITFFQRLLVDDYSAHAKGRASDQIEQFTIKYLRCPLITKSPEAAVSIDDFGSMQHQWFIWVFWEMAMFELFQEPVEWPILLYAKPTSQ
jgi:hypothetical protein